MTGQKKPRASTVDVKHDQDPMGELYEDLMGRERGATVRALEKQWIAGLLWYRQLRELFGTKERVELLSALGTPFWRGIQEVLWNELILRVTRLTDRRSVAGKNNLTVIRLPELCEDAALREEVQGYVDTAVGAVDKGMRDWRNRYISHTDFALATNPEARPLAPVDLEGIGIVLDAVHASINAICAHYLPGTSIVNDLGGPPMAGVFLLNVSQLVQAVLFVDSIIDSKQVTPPTDYEVAASFLRTLNSDEDPRSIIELRKAAERVRKTAPATR